MTIEYAYHGHAVEQRHNQFYVPGLRQTFPTEALAHAAIDAVDPIMESNQRQDKHWQSVGGRTDGVTDKVSFAERYELMLRELP